MPISTKNINDKKVTKTSPMRMAQLELERFHRPLFDLERVKYPKFIPRLCYNDSGLGEKVIGLYPKEIYGGHDIYVEFCNKNNQPEDPNRTLWKWIYNPEFSTEYKKSDPHPATGDRRYIIPIEELVNVTELHAPKNTEEATEEETIEEKPKEELEFEDVPDANSDVPYESMTLRDYAAIQWKKPVSHKKWLNELVKQNQV